MFAFVMKSGQGIFSSNHHDLRSLSNDYIKTPMPGASRRAFAENQVRGRPVWLIAPEKRGGTVQAEIAIWQKQWVKQHCYWVGWPTFQPFTQVLQILHAHTQTVTILSFFSCLYKLSSSIIFSYVKNLVGFRLFRFDCGKRNANHIKYTCKFR